MYIARLVTDGDCSIRTVTEFARPYNLELRDSREATAEHDAEAV